MSWPTLSVRTAGTWKGHCASRTRRSGAMRSSRLDRTHWSGARPAASRALRVSVGSRTRPRCGRDPASSRQRRNPDRRSHRARCRARRVGLARRRAQPDQEREREVIETDAVRRELAAFPDVVLREGEHRARGGFQDRAGAEGTVNVPIAKHIARAEQSAIPGNTAVEVADAELDTGDPDDLRHRFHGMTLIAHLQRYPWSKLFRKNE